MATRQTRTLDEVGIDAMCLAIADGQFITDMAKRYKVSHWALHRFLRRPEHAAIVADAKRASATRHVEEAQRMVDAETDPKMAPLLKLRIDQRQWLARSRDPEQYGDRRQVQVSGAVDVQHLHLVALRRAQTVPASLPRAAVAELAAGDSAPAVDAEFELLDGATTRSA